MHLTLLSYLEGNHLIGPSLETFKVAMLSKKLYKVVMQAYGVTTFREFASLYAKQQILMVLETQPPIHEMQLDTNNLAKLYGLLRNQIFGGSIFNGI